MFLENNKSQTLPLDGLWKFRLGNAPEVDLPVPSAWEAHTADKLTDGPALYRRAFFLPASWLGARILLEADAISFDATVRVNNQLAGTHRGLWSPFQLDITRLAREGENTIEIEVWKPGGRFPLREALAGFLPDVATTFGGLWQGIRLRSMSWAAFDDLRVFAYGGGWLDVQGRVVALGERRAGEVIIDLLDADEQLLTHARAVVGGDQSFAIHVETGGVTQWEPVTGAPCYTLRLSLQSRGVEVAQATRRVGFRDVAVVDGKTILNSQPLHLRGVLDWGWDAARICPTPTRAELLDQFAKARALGFNLVKLCLFVPDETTFEVADEAGMLLWLELPMWLPKVTPEFRELALREYQGLFRRLHHHPSIIVVSLGCELNADADAGFLRELDNLADEWMPNALHCDNSGSAEAYGGVSTRLSEFYDYHFYTDPHFFQPLVQHFHRLYQPAKPWLYGEFCDADTLRDFSKLDPETWWLTQPTALTRDDFLSIRDYRTRLGSAAIEDGGLALTGAARCQATAIRKFIVEQVRAHGATGGHVITGWADTPITTSGVVDDQRELKFSPDEWRQFNAPRVLTMDRERRRRWLGGDRPAHKDPFTCWAGEAAEIHLVLSNGAGDVEGGRLQWRLTGEDGNEIMNGSRDDVAVSGGESHEIAILHFKMPLVTEKPIELTLSAEVETCASNSWKLWVVPRISSLSLGRPETGPGVRADLTDDLLRQIHQGQSAVLWLRQPDPRFTRNLPFWRESIHTFEPHAFWERLPHPGYADMRFFSVATDFAIDIEKLSALFGPEARLKPIWRRFDARQMFWTEYVVEAVYGAGRLVVTTLRFEGGLGVQPGALDTNPIGAWMLKTLLEM
ncbi:MAG: hypothetical protein HYZ49_07190 [Chloroflexi bacterium]|nr:hypothetical protein [Chloroflexota bacterium]